MKKYVRGQIAAGKYPDGRIESEGKLVEVLGVSRSTVREGLSELEYEGVIDIVHGKGTFVCTAQTRIKTVSYVFSRVESESYDNPYYGGVFAGVEEEAKRIGAAIEYRSYGRKELLAGAADSHRFENPTVLVSYFPRAVIERAIASGVPFAAVDNLHEGLSFPTVVSEGVAAAYEAVSHLISLGHRKIAHVTGNMMEYSGKERLLGYKKALAAAGIAIDAALIIEGDFTWDAGYRAGEELAARKSEFTAAYFAGDTMAIAAMQYLMKQGVRVPEDVSIVGTDDIPAASQPMYSLTTMRLDTCAMGRSAMSLLADQCAGKREAPVMRVPRSLIVRSSAMSIG
ncbi:MAG: GntR family transcriptional regulator [Spirochaetota bacterium]